MFSKGPLWMTKYPCVYAGLSQPVPLFGLQAISRLGMGKSVEILGCGFHWEAWEVCPGLGIRPLIGPREGSTTSEKRTGEEEKEEHILSILQLAGVQEREWLLLLPVPAHASFILGPSSSITSAVGLWWGSSHKPNSHIQPILIENFSQAPNNWLICALWERSCVHPAARLLLGTAPCGHTPCTSAGRRGRQRHVDRRRRAVGI